MTPEIVIDRVQSYLRWNASRIDVLDEDHEPIANPACYRRGDGDRREYWITAVTWRDVLFTDSADEALEAARILCDVGLLRPLDHLNLQVCAKIRGKVTKIYALRGEVVSLKVTSETPTGHGGNGYARLELINRAATAVSSPPALISLPPPPTFPPNFNEIPPGERQDYLLSAGMYLQAHLLNLSIKLAPEDAKAIAQLASVAQAVVQTSVKLEQIKVERQDKDDNLRDILERLRNFQP